MSNPILCLENDLLNYLTCRKNEWNGNERKQCESISNLRNLAKIDFKRQLKTHHNVDNQFDFSVNYEKGKLVIIIDKDSMNDNTFEELIKLMYLHTLM